MSSGTYKKKTPLQVTLILKKTQCLIHKFHSFDCDVINRQLVDDNTFFHIFKPLSSSVVPKNINWYKVAPVQN